MAESQEVVELGLFGQATAKRIVVKSYGRDGLLGLANPLLTLIARTFGMQIRLKSEDQVLIEMGQDAVAMIKRGYRIGSSEQYEMPPFGVTWHKVTYELVDHPR